MHLALKLVFVFYHVTKNSSVLFFPFFIVDSSDLLQ